MKDIKEDDFKIISDNFINVLNFFINELDEVEEHIKNGYSTFYDDLILSCAYFVCFGAHRIVDIINKEEGSLKQ